MNTPLPPIQVSRIAIFQALQLGDLLCTTPAMRALRQHYPDAEITLIGSAWAGDMVARLPSVDRFIPFPGYPGIAESPMPPPATSPAWPHFDLAIQLHGAGSISNGFIASLDAALTLGHGDPGDDRLTFRRPWREAEPKPLQWLRLISLLGVPDLGSQLEFPLMPDERHRAASLIGATGSKPVVGVHVGASIPERRWPPESFAAVIDGIAARIDCRFILTGSAPEREWTARTQAATSTPVINLAGMTSLGEFGAVISQFDLLLTNDTGASHMAAAMGTPSVVLFGPADPRRWAPLDAGRHRVINARDYAHPEDGARALKALPPDVVLNTCLDVLRAAPSNSRETLLQEQMA